MASKQRVVLASMWGLEEIGAEEIGNELKKGLPHADLHCEYGKSDGLLVVKGSLEESMPQLAARYSGFIEEQRDKDLLDMPRICPLDLPRVLQDGEISSSVNVENCQEGGLLALEDTDEELIPCQLPTPRVTKTWISPRGGVGCFATGYSSFLEKIATLTGTEIIVLDEPKGIKVSGSSLGDVDDAFAKLTRIEKPLSCLVTPQVTSIGIAAKQETSQYSICSYGNLSPGALKRVLTDPTMSSHFGLRQMFVTVSLSFDEGTQTYKLPENLTNPRPIGNEPGNSRIWSDFTFPPIGSGDNPLSLEPLVEKETTGNQAAPSIFSPSHPYLTVEKAKQVNEWVVEGTEVEVQSGQPEQPAVSPSEGPGEASLTQGATKHQFIKARRVAPSAHNPPSSPVKQADRIKTPDTDSKEEDAPTPRKRWKMMYESGLGNPNLQTDGPIPRASDTTPNAVNSFTNDSSPVLKKDHLTANFDSTKYGLNKPPHIPKRNRRNMPESVRTNSNTPRYKPMNKIPKKPHELVDVATPSVASSRVLSSISMNQPALIPQNASMNILSQEPLVPDTDIISNTASSVHDLDGLVFPNVSVCQPGPGTSTLTQETKAVRDENFTDQVKRLSRLEKAFKEQEDKVTHTSDFLITGISTVKTPRELNALLAKRRLEELEKACNSDEKQSVNELTTRRFHHTMNQKAPNPNGKANAKPMTKAKRQATLEDAWGIPKGPTKNKPGQGFGALAASGITKRLNLSPAELTLTNKQQPLDPKDDISMEEYILQLYRALQPTLEAAEYFPGSLNLEVQIGLLLTPILPKAYQECTLTLDEWTQIFQPRSGVSAPTMKFIDRLTTSGLDIDHIVDLKTSKKDGKRRLFQQTESEYSVFYEFHCRNRADQLLIITVDEQGKHSITKPTEELGTLNIHFPGSIWDARVVVSGNTVHSTGNNKEFEEAAQFMVDHLSIQPNQTLIRIDTRLPNGDCLTIERVYMKRWTRHRHIRPDDISKCAVSLNSSTGISNTQGTENHADIAGDSERDNPQGIFLQVTEVQDLLIESATSDSQALSARCITPLTDMIRKGRQWYEVSIVSPVIEALLDANKSIEVGERTDDWSSCDLLGSDVALLNSDTAVSSSSGLLPSAVASVIGPAGIGGLLRLTRAVVEKIDGVGNRNHGPIDPSRLPVLGSVKTQVVASMPYASSKGTIVKVVNRSLEFDELESIKEVGSVIVDVQRPCSTYSALKEELIEQEFW
ncbi:hypothetical protein BDV25DRAFT_141797 [Aspergillus avenaceus]|uniref:Uncharacterized protein n=1 Tax=Aspergillus avenaceus TaxID=36643 RepID=A0A5N6TPY5_ASPAV|nr:hypothetical protein BDV25DRAFT_141797 [Aspergillus avenaceus]